MNQKTKKFNSQIAGWSEGGNPPPKSIIVSSIDIDAEGNKTITFGPKGGQQTKGSIDDLIESLNLEGGLNPKEFSEDDIRKYFETQFKKLDEPEPPKNPNPPPPPPPRPPSGGPPRPEPPTQPGSDSESEPTKAECDCIDCFDEYSKKIRAVVGNIQNVLLNQNVSIPGCPEADSAAKDPRCIDTGSIGPIQPSDMTRDKRFGRIKEMIKEYLRDIGLICGGKPEPGQQPQAGCDGYTEDADGNHTSAGIDLTSPGGNNQRPLGRIDWDKSPIKINIRFRPQGGARGGLLNPRIKEITVNGCEGLAQILKASSNGDYWFKDFPPDVGGVPNTENDYLASFKELNPGINLADMAERCCRAYLEKSLSQGAGNDIFGPPVVGGRFGDFSGVDPGGGADWKSGLFGSQPPCGVGRQSYLAFDQSLACCFGLDCPTFVCKENANNKTKINTIIKELTTLGSDSGCIGRLKDNINQISEKIVRLLLKTYFGEFLGSTNGAKPWNPLPAYTNDPTGDIAWVDGKSCAVIIRDAMGLPEQKTTDTITYLNLCEMGYTDDMVNDANKPLSVCKFPIHFKIPFTDERLGITKGEDSVIDRYRKLIEQIKRYLRTNLTETLQDFSDLTPQNTQEWCDALKTLKRQRQNDLNEYELSINNRNKEIREIQKQIKELEDRSSRRKDRERGREDGYPTLPGEDDIFGKNASDDALCKRLRAKYIELKDQAIIIGQEFAQAKRDADVVVRDLEILKQRITKLNNSKGRFETYPDKNKRLNLEEKFCECNPTAVVTKPDGTKYCPGYCLTKDRHGISVDSKFIATANEGLQYIKLQLDQANAKEEELRKKKDSLMQLLTRLSEEERAVKNNILDILKEIKAKCDQTNPDGGDPLPIDDADDYDTGSDLGDSDSDIAESWGRQIDILKQLVTDLNNLIEEDKTIIENIKDDIARIEEQISIYCEDPETGKRSSPLSCLLDCVSNKVNSLTGEDLGMSLGPYIDSSDIDKDELHPDCPGDKRPPSGPGTGRNGVPGIEPGIEIFDETSAEKLRTSIINIITACVGLTEDGQPDPPDPRVDQICKTINTRLGIVLNKIKTLEKVTIDPAIEGKTQADIAKELELKREELIESIYIPGLTDSQKRQEAAGEEPTLLPGQRKIERIKPDKQAEYETYLTEKETKLKALQTAERTKLQLKALRKEQKVLEQQKEACTKAKTPGAMKQSCIEALTAVPPGGGKSLAETVVDLVNDQSFKDNLLDQLRQLLNPDPDEPPLNGPDGKPLPNIRDLKEDFKKKIQDILFAQCPPLEYKDESGNTVKAPQLLPADENNKPIISDDDIMIVCVGGKPTHLGITANIQIRQYHNPDQPINCFGKILAEILNATIICKDQTDPGSRKSIFHDLTRYFIDKEVGKQGGTINSGWDGKSRLGPRWIPEIVGEGPYFYPPPNDYQVEGEDITIPCPNDCGGALGVDLPMSARFSFLRRMYFEMNAIYTYLENIQDLANFSKNALQKLAEGLLYCGDPSNYRHDSNGDPMDYIDTLIKDNKYKGTVWDKDYDPNIVMNPDGRPVTIEKRIDIINRDKTVYTPAQKREEINKLLDNYNATKFTQIILGQDQSCECKSAKELKEIDKSNEKDRDVNTNDGPDANQDENLTDVQKDIKAAIARLTEKLGRDPEFDEVVDELKDKYPREKLMEEVERWTGNQPPSEPPPFPPPLPPQEESELQQELNKESEHIGKTIPKDVNKFSQETQDIWSVATDIGSVIENAFSNTSESFRERSDKLLDFLSEKKQQLESYPRTEPSAKEAYEKVKEMMQRLEKKILLEIGKFDASTGGTTPGSEGIVTQQSTQNGRFIGKITINGKTTIYKSEQDYRKAIEAYWAEKNR